MGGMSRSRTNVAIDTDIPPALGRPGSTVAAVCEVLREVAEADLGALERNELLGLLAGLDESARMLEVCRTKALAAVDRTEAWRGTGKDASLTAWRSRTTRTGQGKAHLEVTTARTVATTPGAAEALTAGDLTPAHAEVLGRIATSGGADRREKITDALADPAASGELLASAKHLDAPRFARAAEAWAARLDPLTLEADHAAQRRARYLSVADTPGGTIVKGRLDKMAGHRLRLALEAVTPVPSAGDTRDHGQRAADALDALAQGALTDPTTKPGGHVPPHVSLIITADTLAALHQLHEGPQSGNPQAGSERAGSEQGGSGMSFDPATFEDGTSVPPSETARILCDAQITRIVLDAESVPIDLGRTKRLWTGPQRRLVIARDRHCAFPGCQIPARWCEIHHITWWARDNGLTNIDNAVLLCTHHHGAVHTDDLTLARDPAPPGPRGASLPLATYTITGAGTAASRRTWHTPAPGASTPTPGASPPASRPLLSP